MTQGQIILLGPFHFSVIRILVLVGIIRVAFRREVPEGGLNGLDWLIIIWGLVALLTALFHNDPKEVFINRLGRACDAVGVYFILRCFCRGLADARILVTALAILLLPVAIEMVYEQIAHRNLFSVFGGVAEVPAFREGRFRSEGPFRHPILAGTLGAVSAPLFIGILRIAPFAAKIGIFSCLTMVVTSASSGPLLSLFVSIFGILLWKWRHLTKQLRIAAVALYIFLEIVMEAPAYFLIARADIVSGSTGWHRAAVIQSAIKHIEEWWMVGTDYTRHWMPTGASWSPDHTDITNHYIMIGVWGGLPLLIGFLICLWLAFKYVGEYVKNNTESAGYHRFFIWAFGASLFSYAVTFLSVSFFDQSSIFFYLELAVISSMRKHVAQQVS